MGEDTEKPSSDSPPSAVDDSVAEKIVVSTETEAAAAEAVPIDPPPPDAVAASASFVEESYYVKDLKGYEKKALQELKAKIHDAVKNNCFLILPKENKAKEAPPAEKKEAEVIEAEKKEAEEKEAEEVKSGGEDDTEGKKEADAIEAPPPAQEEAPLEEPTAQVPRDTEAAEVNAGEAKDGEENVDEDDGTPGLDDLELWGVPLLYSKGDERTDVVLLKFLRAREFKVGDALEMLKDTVTWRKEFGADGLLEEEITSKFDSVAYMHSIDREGHPVCYNSYGVFQDKELYQKTFGDEAQFKDFLRWRIQVLEKGIKALDFSPGGVHSILQVVDLKDSPGFVKRRNITKRAFSILQDNYPELVAKQIFINVPWYFGALITLHGKIISLRTKSKYVVARPDKATETLFKYISPENVPVRYGGFSRPNDSDFVGVEAPVKDITIKAGEKQTIEFPVEEAGSTVVWDVFVVGWEVVYGEEFVPSTEGSYTIIIQKTKKVSSSEEPIRNSFKASEPGKVVITIDNTSWRKKVAVYRHVVKNGDAPKDC